MKSKMTGEVCMFDKLQNSCKKVHLKEICLLEECENKQALRRGLRSCSV